MKYIIFKIIIIFAFIQSSMCSTALNSNFFCCCSKNKDLSGRDLCSIASKKLLCALKKSNLKKIGFVFPKKLNKRHTNFIVKTPINSNLYKKGIAYISQAVPTDAAGNRLIDGVSRKNLPTTYEIALFDTNSALIYSHPLCDQFLRVNSYKDLVALYKKLLNYTQDTITDVGNDPEIQRNEKMHKLPTYLEAITLPPAYDNAPPPSYNTLQTLK